ncbi:alcohol dehydrogenase [Klebsiella aerogenes]|nr:alcohol dehydrogenase [Klebsiella aerogenes]
MPHGVANAVLLPHVARYNLIANPEKFADIAELMGENITGLSTLDAAEKAIAAITHLSMDIGIPQHLRDLGVKEADFPYMAEMALKDGNAFSNPRKGNEQEIAAIFRQAF